MRAVKRNQQPFWYALYSEETEQVDGEGNYTGEIGPSYGSAVQMYANISAARGNADTDVFGTDLKYSKTIMTCDMSCPITEESILWIGIEPEDANKNPMPHNYTVVKVAKSLTNIQIAVEEVQLTNEPVQPVPPDPDPDPDPDPEPDPDDPDDPDGD